MHGETSSSGGAETLHGLLCLPFMPIVHSEQSTRRPAKEVVWRRSPFNPERILLGPMATQLTDRGRPGKYVVVVAGGR